MTTTDDAMTRLRRVNPVLGLPQAPNIDLVLRKLDAHSDDLPAPPAARARRRPIAALAIASVLVAAVVVTFAIRAGGGDVDVAAAAFRAVGSGNGITHAVMTTTTSNPHGSGSSPSAEVQSWSAPEHGQLHVIQKTGTETVEWTTDPERQLTWSSQHPDVIREHRFAAAGERSTQQDPIAELRAAYEAHQLRVVGKVDQAGRPVWQLRGEGVEESTGFSTTTLVDVDGESFVPLRIVTEVKPAGETTAESALRTVTTFSSFTSGEYTQSSAEDLGMSPHPGATVQP